jgi:hypothetical protein
VVPPAFAAVHDYFLRNCLRITITGEPDSLTAPGSSDLSRSVETTEVVTTKSPSERDIGEVDFAFYPTISH